MLKKNVEIGASIMIGDSVHIQIQKEAKDSNSLLSNFSKGTIFVFRSKDEVYDCREKALTPFKLRVRNETTNTPVYQ